MSIFIIAEIGINHNGDMSICKQLIDIALDTGCDAVKFQKRDLNKVYTKDLPILKNNTKDIIEYVKQTNKKKKKKI